MVLTRNQKRKGHDDDVSDIQTQQENVNVTTTVSRKRVKQNSGDAPNEGENMDLVTEPSFITESDTQSDGDIQWDGSSEDSSGQPIIVLDDIVKNAMRHLVRKYEKGNDDHNQTLADPHARFLSWVNNIHNGRFFQRVPIEEQKKRLEEHFNEEQINSFNQQLESLSKMYKENAPSIVDILNMNVHETHKMKLLEKMYQLANSDVLTAEYNSSLKYLLTNINKTQEPELFELEQKVMKCAQSEELSDNYRKKILKSKMPFDNKVIAYKRLEVMERYEDSDSSEFAKYKNWMDILLSVPFGNYTKVPSIQSQSEVSDDAKLYIKRVREVLDKRLSFLEKPKDQVINVVTRMIRNPDFCMNAIGLYGPPGVGKSSIVKSIAEALGRPYRSISLGGESDASLLAGHGFTYVGSNPGRIIEILSDTKTMSPVILIDEVDKVSQTHHGKEIIGTLIHLTDNTTNNKYNYDRYFAGIEFDLSQVLFVFTYNDPSKVDKILADRLFKIKVENYSLKEKLEIAEKHVITNILEEYNFTRDQVDFSEEAVNYIINTSKNDEGMRDIKRKFEIIVSRINTLVMTDPSEDIIRLPYKSLYTQYHEMPIKVAKEHVDTFLSDSCSNDSSDLKPPPPHMYI